MKNRMCLRFQMFIETRYRLEIFNTHGGSIKSKRRYRVSALQVALQNQNLLIVDPFQKKNEKRNKKQACCTRRSPGNRRERIFAAVFFAIDVYRKP